MQLWLLRTPDRFGSDDVYDSFVCAAETEQEARETHPNTEFGWKWNGKAWQSQRTEDFFAHDWVDPSRLIVTELGIANIGIVGVICASFNAA